MDKTMFDQRYELYLSEIERYLAAQFEEQPHWADLYESMRYSLLAGGKRIRPVLTLEFARIAGVDWRQALPVACALEFVHTYSLIHDDLPCMDDDDLRRGKPTCHKVYGETMAVLAGDALQPEAFALIAGADGMSAQQRIDAVAVLSAACGGDGMVAGQVLDTEGLCHNVDEVKLLHRLKTGAMLCAACELGCVAADAAVEIRKKAVEYGRCIGLAFQIRDDVLDVIADQAEFGKPVGSDREEGKVTFVDLLGMEACQAQVAAETEKAKAAIANIPNNDFLMTLAQWLAERRK